MWEYSSSDMKYKKFAMIASSDTHRERRLGSAETVKYTVHNNPSCLIATYTIHNNRHEIWDAMNNCS
jgi:hypothetical protein